jgi:prevent-host-death family protein
MPDTYNVHDAKTHLSRLLERAERGEEIVIARSGRPVAKLVPFRTRRRARRLGQWKGQGWIAPDFDETPPEMVRLFEEGE